VVVDLNNLEQNGIGDYDDSVLTALDKVLAKLKANGMKAIISPHDGNAFGYNRCVYTNLG
jgi:mannan endo-1,4-beta-mannosidase